MKILFKNARIIDGTGNAPIECGEMLINGERIEAIGELNSINCSDDIEIKDARAYTITAGIIDSHVHILSDYTSPRALLLPLDESEEVTRQRAKNNLYTMLKSGITYARDLGGYRHINTKLAQERAQNMFLGAEFISAGEALTSKKGHIWEISRQCDTVESVKNSVEDQINAGVKVIKLLITGGHGTKGVHPTDLQFDREHIAMAVNVAHAAGLKVSAHVNGYKAIKMAVEEGIDCFEHCEFFPNDDPLAVKELMAFMAEKHVFYVPTLVAWFKHYPELYGYLGDIDEKALAEPYLRQLDEIRPQHLPKEYMCMQQILDNASALYKAGVKVCMGTDSGIPKVAFEKYPFEFKLMKKMGMSNLEIISSATKANAELLEIDKDYGTLAAGKYADFLLLKENPLDTLDAFYSLEEVYKKGALVK